MKLLFDENLSPILPTLLGGTFPGSGHARREGFVIVSKDSDFVHRTIIHGAPPKVVWLRIGNCTRDDLLQLIVTRAPEILNLEGNPNEAVLALG